MGGTGPSAGPSPCMAVGIGGCGGDRRTCIMAVVGCYRQIYRDKHTWRRLESWVGPALFCDKGRPGMCFMGRVVGEGGVQKMRFTRAGWAALCVSV